MHDPPLNDGRASDSPAEPYCLALYTWQRGEKTRILRLNAPSSGLVDPEEQLAGVMRGQ